MTSKPRNFLTGNSNEYRRALKTRRVRKPRRRYSGLTLDRFVRAHRALLETIEAFPVPAPMAPMHLAIARLYGVAS